MQIAIITTPREPVYVYETIAQIQPGLAIGESIELFSDDPSHTLDYERRLGAKHRKMPPTLWQVASGMKRYQRACLNFLSALLSGWGDLVLFEDDIKLKPSWRYLLQGIIDESQADLVSLYWPDDGHLKHVQHSQGYYWREYKTPVTFHGSLGLYVKGYMRCAFTHHLQRALLRHQQGIEDLLPFDNCVAALCNEHPVTMVAAMPALVDHRGEVSAIPENASHGLRRSPGYTE